MPPYRWRRRAIQTLGLAAVAAALAAVLAVLIDWVRNYQPAAGAEPPKVTDWLQGWGSVAAVFAGLFAALFTGALLWHEMREARQARRDAARERAAAERDREEARRDRELLAEERRDAEMLPARTVVVGDVQVGAGHGAIDMVRMEPANYGPGPILNVTVSLVGSGPLEGLRAVVTERGALGPGETLRIHKPVRPAPSTRGLGETAALAALNAEITFTDMYGRKWVRLGTNQPERVFDLSAKAPQPRRSDEGPVMAAE